MYLSHNNRTNHYSATFCDNSERMQDIPDVLIQNDMMVLSTSADDARMLLDIPSPMNYVGGGLGVLTFRDQQSILRGF